MKCEICGKDYSSACDYNQGRCPKQPPLIKLRALTPGEYMFATGLIYFIVGMINLFWYKFAEIEYIQMTWVLILALPLCIPMQRIVKIDPFWRM